MTRRLSGFRRTHRAANGRVVAQILAARTAPATDAVDAVNGDVDAPAPGADALSDAQTIKAQFDALGVAVRAGVDPDDAAARIGLPGVKFTGAVPVSLRMAERDAAVLEDN